MFAKRLKDVGPYTTKDGSLIYEALHPSSSPARGFSVALAVLKPGQRTARHRHVNFEEVYVILRGSGRVEVGDEGTEVGEGHIIYIPPDELHCAIAGVEGMEVLCVCCPPYSHEGTVLEEV